GGGVRKPYSEVLNMQLQMFEAPKPARSFEKDGYGFLLKFARKTRGQPFCAESVTLAAERVGILPSDRRHWGKYFVQARNDGYIARCDTVFRRELGNGTLTLGWVAL
ncbi:MAG: hypothetical protein B7X10_00540, partial [Burkholderiales bacterium 21-58-4]